MSVEHDREHGIADSANHLPGTNGTLLGTESGAVAQKPFSASVVGSNIVQRGTLGQVPVRTAPTDPDEAAPFQHFTSINAPHRFPNRTDSTISFNAGLRRFTIAPTGVSFKLFIKGILYTKTTETVDITNTEGVWYIYYNSSGLLTASQLIWDLQNHAPVAFLYWNAPATTLLLFCDERHGTVMDSATHAMLHSTIGTRYAAGLALSYLVGDGSLDAHAQVALADGLCYDEDLPISIVDGTPQDIRPIAYIPVFYLDGATPVWRKKTANTYPLYEGVSRIRYNLNTAGTWTQPDAPTNGNYVAMFFMATNDVNTPVIAILGQRYDTTLNAARDNNKFESLVFPVVPFAELKALYRVIFQTSAAYANTPKARFIEALDLRAGGSLVGGVYTPPPMGVYGLYHTNVETEAETQTASATWATLATLNTGVIPAGKYRIEWSSEYRCTNSVSNYIYMRVQQDATTDYANYTIEVQDQGNYHPLSGFRELNLAAGSYVFTFDQRSEGAINTVANRRVRLSFFRVE